MEGIGETRGTGTDGALLASRSTHRSVVARWRMVLVRSLALGAVVSLVLVASAQSCPTPLTGLLAGGFESTYAQGTWHSFPTFSPLTSETWTIGGAVSAQGSSKLGLGSFALAGNYEGTLNACTGAENFQIPWAGIIYGTPVTGFSVSYYGTATATSASGGYSDAYDGFPETGTWWTNVYPAQQSQGTQAGQAGIIPPAGTDASSFTAAPINPSQLPPGVVAPVGALAFSVTNAPANGTISVTLVLPPGSGPTQVYKSANGVYEPYPAAKTKINGNEITLELTDNELPWDENPAPGVISDPVVPVEPQVGTPPTVTSLSVKKAMAGNETPVTISGTGFTGATVVRFGATEAPHFTVDSPTSISAVTPATAGAGKVEVMVASRGGVSAATKHGRFTFKKPKKPKT